MEKQKLLEFIQTNKPVVLLAPSFPIDFSYPEIISILKGLGCAKVVELTYAAKLINKQYHEHLKNHPEQQRICSNCPTIVQYIKNKFPEHKDKLMPIASPMIIMSRFIKKDYGPETKTLFIGPCLAKKIEAKMTGEVDEAITFKELQELIEYTKIQRTEIDTTKKSDFNDYYSNYTKIYPLAGAVAQTINYKDILKEEQIIICDGIPETNEAIKKMENDTNIKFVDPLSCLGGCIGGPGIISKETTEIKIQKIKAYQEEMKKKAKQGAHIGKLEYGQGLNYKNTFI
ncbi:NtrC family signal transduction histidine kinase [candidate division SR1 bacterium RAAC1_SR1_1]|nr:NtrC family signal transduction histidine kinase [candidate division SR1 bacterium RAAC1_SR1_1]